MKRINIITEFDCFEVVELGDVIQLEVAQMFNYEIKHFDTLEDLRAFLQTKNLQNPALWSGDVDYFFNRGI